MRDKYSDFQKNTENYRKIIANQITNDFLKNMMDIDNDTISDKKRNLQKISRYIYTINGGLLDLLNQIKKT